ncbi:molybdopterin-guanine dinucleotide biosynthesis protein A [Actinosynnema sp. ALI-1.44]|uniref:nucleotidyltransferase family protein n=1 Tax=Actinosynnema sp. ALI-1.44 TaxID=1933779 RepID=UPI00097BAA19|nr:nucleotidyltransferase family protein [Actinosynnema sp. ALI-1.44]ONI89849.1 molybdopterin-guanine dinucleotide biosynthesis protein A [Actinosynnema sp. ALI-1.44]
MAETRVAGLVLAAGAGSRYGMPKARVHFQGELLVQRAVRVLTGGGCCPVLAVLGADSEVVREEAPDLNAVDNPDWQQGMGSSLRVGLKTLGEADAVIILPVDTPGISAEAITRLQKLASPDALLRASYHGEPGHPVLIGRQHWEGVYELATGDAGAREYLRRHKPDLIPCEDVAEGSDVDTPDQLPMTLDAHPRVV